MFYLIILLLLFRNFLNKVKLTSQYISFHPSLNILDWICRSEFIKIFPKYEYNYEILIDDCIPKI